MSATDRSFTTASLAVDTVEDLHQLKDAHDDPNLDRTVRRLIEHYRGAP